MNELKLSTAQLKVLSILQNERKAMSAYALLERAKSFGLQSPVQIYRILNKLSGHGLILKLDTLNKYLAYELKNKKTCLLVTICTDCQTVEIIDSPQLALVIEQSILLQNFDSRNQYVELAGQCALCFSKHNSHLLT
ncbi:Fur family transcriptional regulator [Acinetobacter pittii]|uniref:Fur family transcriptional regulator n=1 Tax=Acinetobacter pittii TaxID=48296 RepID=UPI000A39A723|nr:transcriptional repressor [Acinetobacter pittii]OTU19993.1 Fur family transcriptional regulator [Acinetobacter pittii]